MQDKCLPSGWICLTIDRSYLDPEKIGEKVYLNTLFIADITTFRDKVQVQMSYSPCSYHTVLESNEEVIEMIRKACEANGPS